MKNAFTIIVVCLLFIGLLIIMLPKREGFSISNCKFIGITKDQYIIIEDTDDAIFIVDCKFIGESTGRIKIE